MAGIAVLRDRFGEIHNIVTDSDGNIIVFENEAEMLWCLRDFGNHHPGAYDFDEIVNLYSGTRRRFRNAMRKEEKK